MLKRAVTRTVGIEAPPAAVVAVVSDPATMPRYAPGFAKSVVREGDGWLLESTRGPLRLTPAINADLGTVDFHLTAVNGTPSTVFTRALPNGSGTEFVFTLFLPSTAPDSAIAEQSDILSQELQLLKELCEPQGAASIAPDRFDDQQEEQRRRQ